MGKNLKKMLQGGAWVGFLTLVCMFVGWLHTKSLSSACPVELHVSLTRRKVLPYEAIESVIQIRNVSKQTVKLGFPALYCEEEDLSYISSRLLSLESSKRADRKQTQFTFWRLLPHPREGGIVKFRTYWQTIPVPPGGYLSTARILRPFGFINLGDRTTRFRWKYDSRRYRKDLRRMGVWLGKVESNWVEVHKDWPDLEEKKRMETFLLFWQEQAKIYGLNPKERRETIRRSIDLGEAFLSQYPDDDGFRLQVVIELASLYSQARLYDKALSFIESEVHRLPQTKPSRTRDELCWHGARAAAVLGKQGVAKSLYSELNPLSALKTPDLEGGTGRKGNR